ncbi:MAG: hypothetical protein NTW28_12495 [Candidatus Solibacter sp.]|nr:hypothetical protein [Candidatus Solibacter sp.]
MNRTEWVRDLFGGNGPAIKDGFPELPGRPGLGLTLNEKVAARPYKPATRPEYKFDDGSVTDQ